LLWMERSPSLNPLLQAKSPTLVGFEENELTDHVIVAGFGRVGQTLVRMLDFQQHPILVIDNDEGVLQSLRDRKIPYLLGDVSSMLVLEKANLSKARTMAITLPDPMATRLTLNRALSLAPDLDITVRAHVNVEIDTLYHLGAQEVVQPEFEAALEMGAHTLLKLGDSAYMVQQLVNRYRNRRYRDIIPRREEYWGSRQLELAVEGLDHRWYELDDRNFLVGQTIVESNLRKLTGATIIAIERKNRLRRYPLGSTTFKAGDRLLVVGNPEEQDAFNQLFQGVKA
ncbi:MAG: NAD-binding protein, partial [Cyanobacteria bacterium P01_A01_bin.3]